MRGLGNEASPGSCSHGAGRRHSRGAARRLFSATHLAEQMAGRSWLAERAAILVHEIPSAYEDIDRSWLSGPDLVQVEHVLHPVLNECV